MTQPKAAAEERLAALEARVTQMEGKLTAAIADFSPVAARLAELSSAFQAANVRLRTIEQAVEALQNAEPPDFSAVLARVEEIASRLLNVERAGNRRGRLSSRLAEIESKIEKIEGGEADGAEPRVPDA